jgi:methyltransferase family protein
MRKRALLCCPLGRGKPTGLEPSAGTKPWVAKRRAGQTARETRGFYALWGGLSNPRRIDRPFQPQQIAPEKGADLARKYETEPATAENFDEVAYLLANADVAAAVAAGRFPSGRDHFDRHGRAEARRQVTGTAAPFTHYEPRPPAPGNALDLFAGRWSANIPGHGYGTAPLFSDHRITWFLDKVGDVTGRRILELGPLEGGHTTMLARAGAAVTAIEANTGAYLRCLIVKEVLGLKAEFLLGNFVPLIAQTRERFDAVVACGVLYHMQHPIAVLDDLARITDTILIWTHYFDDAVLRARKLRHKFADAPARHAHRGATVEVWEQRYAEALAWSGFCGGAGQTSAWLTREGLLGVLERNGYRLSVDFDHTDHPNGPGLAVLAQRS